jgi:hypothetical protein
MLRFVRFCKRVILVVVSSSIFVFGYIIVCCRRSGDIRVWICAYDM